MNDVPFIARKEVLPMVMPKRLWVPPLIFEGAVTALAFSMQYIFLILV